jgi:hypothetical protein
LASTLSLLFSHQFSSPIWQMIKEPEMGLLIIETRDGDNFRVAFSALNIRSNQFLWRDWTLDEKWLIGLLVVNNEVLLLQRFADRGNPDKKNLIAIDIKSRQLLWEATNFSFYNWNKQTIWGIKTLGAFPQAKIDIASGVITEASWKEPDVEIYAEIGSPVQYIAGTPHFETVKNFILMQVHQPIEMGVEYLEYNGFIVTSVYFSETQGLANYLLVFNESGELVLKERLVEKVQGLGMGTFFILSGCLFFVKNRLELVAYTFI